MYVFFFYYFRRLWSIWKSPLATLLSNQKLISLPPMFQSSPRPPTELSDRSGPLPAGTPAARLRLHSLSLSPSPLLWYVLSALRLAPRRTLQDRPPAVSARWGGSVLQWASQSATCLWRQSAQTPAIRLSTPHSTDSCMENSFHPEICEMHV